MTDWIKMKDQRPYNGQNILYFFEPFASYHVGVYDWDTDSVCGKSGFTTVIPEVPFWMPVPKLPEQE